MLKSLSALSKEPNLPHIKTLKKLVNQYNLKSLGKGSRGELLYDEGEVVAMVKDHPSNQPTFKKVSHLEYDTVEELEDWVRNLIKQQRATDFVLKKILEPNIYQRIREVLSGYRHDESEEEFMKWVESVIKS